MEMNKGNNVNIYKFVNSVYSITMSVVTHKTTFFLHFKTNTIKGKTLYI